jgi:hypothetical protein
MKRKNLGKGLGKGYKNILNTDPVVHSMSARGIKQKQKLKQIPKKQYDTENKFKEGERAFIINKYDPSRIRGVVKILKVLNGGYEVKFLSTTGEHDYKTFVKEDELSKKQFIQEEDEETVEVNILKKRHTTTGNPVYEVLIPTLRGKVKGMRKLKGTNRYSFQSYNLTKYLKDYVFKGKKVKVRDFR